MGILDRWRRSYTSPAKPGKPGTRGSGKVKPGPTFGEIRANLGGTFGNLDGEIHGGFEDDGYKAQIQKSNDATSKKEKRSTAPDLSLEAEKVRQQALHEKQVKLARSRAQKTLESRDLKLRDEVIARIVSIEGILEDELNVFVATRDFLQVKHEGTDISYIYMKKGCQNRRGYLDDNGFREEIYLPETEHTVLLKLNIDGSTEKIYRWED